MFKLENLKKIDSGLVLLMLLICIVGGLTVFSTTYFPEKVASQTFFNQILFYIVGFVAFFGLSSFNFRSLDNRFVVFFIFLLSISLLVAVLIFGDYVYDAKRWINIGPFTLQPSELTKIAMIIITAFAFSFKERIHFEKIFNVYEISKAEARKNIKETIKSERFHKFAFSLFSLVVFIVLIMLQKSLGNTLLLTLIYSFILFMSIDLNAKFIGVLTTILLGLNLSFEFIKLPFESPINFAGLDLMLLVMSIALIFVIGKITKFKFLLLLLLLIPLIFVKPAFDFAYNNVLEDYQRNRIETFLNPDPSIELTTDYNRTQSLRAIGSGQIMGKGFLNGNIVKLELLPFAFTDFAFAAFSEQFGFLGSVFLIALYLLLILKILSIGAKSKDNFGKYIAYGVSAMIFLNTAQHIGMNLGLLPITGVPLPLVSSGGSAILTIFIGLGLVQSIEIKEEEDEEEVTDFKQDFGVKPNSVIIKKAKSLSF